MIAGSPHRVKPRGNPHAARLARAGHSLPEPAIQSDEVDMDGQDGQDADYSPPSPPGSILTVP